MSESKPKPVRYSNGKPTSWWRKTPFAVLLVVVAATATALGMRLANFGDPQRASSGLPLASAQAPDAVQQVLRAGKPTIVEFGANNCVSCREMKPILHALAQDPRITVADVDILKEREYIGKYQIRLMPTQVFYNAQGVETGRHMGKISADDILAQLGMAQAGTAQHPTESKAAL